MVSLRRMFLPTLTGAVLSICTGPLLAQEWPPPQPPCDVEPEHRIVEDALEHLEKSAKVDDEAEAAARLRDAHDLLIRALTVHERVDDPTVWYYLGRYYAKHEDLLGADSAFGQATALAPQCSEDAMTYLREMAPQAKVGAIEAWQQDDIDRAVFFFEIARRLEPEDAELLLFMGMMYAGQGQLDSATKYVELGVELASGDPAHERRTRQALLELARAHEATAYQDPAVNRVAASRIRRDSLRRAVARDSTMLAELIAEWSGVALRPEARRAVQRDSARLAQRLAAGRAALPEATDLAARDSAAAAAALQPGLEAYATYLDAFPDDVTVSLSVLRRYSIVGHTAEIDRMIESLAAQPDVAVGDLTQAGVALYNEGNVEQAARLLEAVMARNPYYRDALLLLCRAYYNLENGAQLRALAQRLLDMDPLNPHNVRMMAAAWELAGNRDSTRKYVALADGGIGWSVSVTQMVHTAVSNRINGVVSNLTARELGPLTLEFDFLDQGGDVIATGTVDVPSLAPQAYHTISLELEPGGAVGWRYRRREGGSE